MSAGSQLLLSATLWRRLYPYRAQLLDLTYTRALVQLPSPLLHGEVVRLASQLMPHMTFFVEGLVEELAVNPRLLGDHPLRVAAVRFTKLRPDSLAALQTFLDHRAAERRIDTRVFHEVPVRFNRDDKLFSEYTLNISRGGMFIQTQRPVGHGSTVTVRMELPGNNEIRIDGEVVFELPLTKALHLGRAPGVGVRFIRFHGDSRERLEAYIAALRVRMGNELGDEIDPLADPDAVPGVP